MSGIGGFHQRQIHMDDPVVCSLCAATLGTVGGLRTDEAKASAQAAHAPECKQRRAHQQAHRRLAGPCAR